MSNVHALQDILRFLNSHDFKRDSSIVRHLSKNSPQENSLYPVSSQTAASQASRYDFHDLDEGPLQIANANIVADYATLRLSSTFQTIINSDGAEIGYKAHLRAASNAARHYNLDISKLALAASDRGEIVYLDRLTRTLHALNYLAEDLRGDLHMSVNPRHLLEVHGNHGAVFEQILSKCGLETDRIVLEISEYVSNKEHLQLAIAGWRQRRYKIAFDGFNVSQAQIARVLKHRPDIVKVDIRALDSVAFTVSSRQLLEAALEEFRNNGIESIATNIENVEHYETAQCYQFTALQGAWLNADVAEEVTQKAAVV